MPAFQVNKDEKSIPHSCKLKNAGTRKTKAFASSPSQSYLSSVDADVSPRRADYTASRKLRASGQQELVNVFPSNWVEGIGDRSVSGAETREALYHITLHYTHPLHRGCRATFLNLKRLRRGGRRVVVPGLTEEQQPHRRHRHQRRQPASSAGSAVAEWPGVARLPPEFATFRTLLRVGGNSHTCYLGGRLEEEWRRGKGGIFGKRRATGDTVEDLAEKLCDPIVTSLNRSDGKTFRESACVDRRIDEPFTA